MSMSAPASGPAPPGALDSEALLERVLDVLQEDEYLKGTISEFRIGELATPEGGRDFPLLYVTTDQQYLFNPDNTGTSVDGFDVQNTLRLKIGIVVNSVSRLRRSDPATATEIPTQLKRDLLRLSDAVINRLRANPRLKLEGRDPMVVRSTVLQMSEEGKFRGQTAQIASIPFQVQTGSQWVATIENTGVIPEDGRPVPDLVIPVLSKQGETTANGVEVVALDTGTRMLAGMDRRGTLGIEYERDPILYEALEKIMRRRHRTRISIGPEGKEAAATYRVWPLSQQATAQFDQIDRVVALFEILR